VTNRSHDIEIRIKKRRCHLLVIQCDWLFSLRYCCIVFSLKKRGRGLNGPHRFSLRGSDFGFSRPRKNLRTLAHAREGQALRRAQREDFFTHERKFIPAGIRTHDLVGAMLPGWASQLGRRTFRVLFSVYMGKKGLSSDLMITQLVSCSRIGYRVLEVIEINLVWNFKDYLPCGMWTMS